MHTREITIRDPFVYRDDEQQCYYLYGTTDLHPPGGKVLVPGVGFNCWKSTDLTNWEGPMHAFRPPEGFWAEHQFWAPEVFKYRGAYYMLATFKAHERYRGTQVLRADSPEGPFLPISEGPVTPDDWQCLDGTLYVDTDGAPWMIFCHEWVQVYNGGMWATRLSEDLTRAVGRPQHLFNAAEAPWKKKQAWPDKGGEHPFPIYVTDGPWMYEHSNGSLLMLWSSFGDKGYAMGLARSTTGTILGPWEQMDQPLWKEDGGHGMIFETFEGEKRLVFHTPNQRYDERAVFYRIAETADGLQCSDRIEQ